MGTDPIINYYVGDCRETLRALADGSVGCVVTSPPYNIGVKYDVWMDDLPYHEYRSLLRDVSTELHRVLEPGGSVFLQVGGKPSDPMRGFRILNEFLGEDKLWEVQNEIIWVKSISISEDTRGHFKTVNSERYLNSTHEYIFHLSKTGDAKLNRTAIGVPYKDKSNIARFKGIKADLRCRGNTWFIPYPTVHGAKPHPASFPLEVPLWCIKLSGTSGIVLDPFAGSGTTLKAAQQLGLNAIGMDVSEAYCKMWEELKEIG